LADLNVDICFWNRLYAGLSLVYLPLMSDGTTSEQKSEVIHGNEYICQ